MQVAFSSPSRLSFCVGYGLLFPQMAMYPAWQALLPGFHWLSWPAFIQGLVESYAYGWYLTLIWVPLYNVLSVRAGDHG